MKLAYIIPAAIALTGFAVHYSFAQANSQTNPQASKSSYVMASSNAVIEPTGDRQNQGKDPNKDAKPRPTGGLFVQVKDGKQQVFPLKHTEVKANVTGNVSRVEVTQTFQNPFDRPLEAIYVFPLPDEAAVDEMEIKIGDRVIKGNIKKRDEAKAIYDRARQQGRTAALLDQERDNIFTQSLANIKPGEQIDVTIRYTESLKFEKGNYEFVFPMVVGSRYIPGQPLGNGKDTTQVPDASRITPPVLTPGTRSGHDIHVTVNLDAGVPIQDIRSTSHKLNMRRTGDRIELKLSPEDTIPNKDLIVRYQVASEQAQSTVLSTSTDQGGHFATYLIPAIDYRTNEIVPKDVVFLMDTSGSQSGDPLLKSQELMRRFINGLNPDDTFTIIDFATTTKQLSSYPLKNTAANRQKAIAYVDKLDAEGGTELMNGINAVMNFPSPSDGRVRSIVLITDGYIGNDNEVIAAVQKRLKPGNRLYSFGVGSSTNRFLLNRLAEVGRGTAQVVRQDEPTQAVAEKFFQQINNPVLTNIQVKWEGSGVAPEIYPSAAPDLFANQPLVLYGRKQDTTSGILRITGTAAGGKRYEKTISVNFPTGSDSLQDASRRGNTGIAQLWGRARIKDLMNQMFGNEVKSLVDAVTNTALSYHLMSQYTSFVAVSEEVRVNPDGGSERVQVPVEIPQGVSYDGIFGADKDSAQVPGTVMPLAPPAPYPARTGRAQPSLNTTPMREEAKVDPADLTAKKPASETQSNFQSNPRIQVMSVTGATGVSNVSLEQAIAQHLRTLSLPSGSGTIVLEFPVVNGRVGKIILDDTASTLTDTSLVELIKRSLLTWSVPASAQGTIRLTLQIN
ncbi:VIT domain-containing protein [Tumidithrix helvetica PCC 7403]|uniref:VIT domain-containing protein n=1 Tax=Tumidithrix helvetica TaxID=3457545 RepID=UPI003CAC01D7